MPKIELNDFWVSKKGSIFPAMEDEPRLSTFDILIQGIGIILAHTLLFNEFAPFGIAFLAMERRFSKRALIALLMTMAGTIALWDKAVVIKYLLAQLLYMSVLFCVGEYSDNTEASINSAPARRMEQATVCGAIASGCVFISGFALIVWRASFGVIPLVTLAIESLVVFVSVYVFDKSRYCLSNKASFASVLNNDEKLSLCIIACIAILSFKQFTILSVFSFSHFLSIAIVMIFAVTGGVALSTASGIVLGFVCGLGSGDILSLVAVFGFCSLAAGIGAKYGKFGAPIAFLIADIALVIYINGAVDTVITIYEAIAAAALVIILPKPFYLYMDGLINSNTRQQNNSNTNQTRINEFLKNRLSKVSELFLNLGQTYYSVFDKTNVINYADVSSVFDTAADRVCKNCKKCMICWEKEFNSTYQTMFKLLAVMERKNEVTAEDVPIYFKERCVKLKPLLVELNSLYDIYRVNCLWKAKLDENRELLGEQFKGISWMMRELMEEIDQSIEFDARAEKSIASILSEKGLNVKRVTVSRGSDEKYETEVIIKPHIQSGDENIVESSGSVCGHTREQCVSHIKKAIKTVLNISVTEDKINDCQSALCLSGVIPEEEIYIQDNSRETFLAKRECVLRFNERETFSISCGIASSGFKNDEENGDKHCLINLGKGKYAVAISDGMGFGDKAAKESGAIVSLLQKFLQSGFDKTVAIKMINSIMALKSSRDSYSTIDMCVMDLYTGEIEFIKIGAVASYIKRKNKVEAVRAASLPVGVLSNIEIETFSRTVGNNDIIIMVSDGLEDRENGDTGLKEFIDNAETDIPPQLLADMLLEKANEQNNGEINDDMTVIAIKIENFNKNLV